MNEEKKMPEWGEIVHVDGEPFVVIDVKRKDASIRVADLEGDDLHFKCNEFDEYKPRIITINGMEVPEPVREPLEDEQEYWTINLDGSGPESHIWKNDRLDYQWLDSGLIHLTEENAVRHIDAIINANKGESG
jgi:hypothetical protein